LVFRQVEQVIEVLIDHCPFWLPGTDDHGELQFPCRKP